MIAPFADGAVCGRVGRDQAIGACREVLLEAKCTIGAGHRGDVVQRTRGLGSIHEAGAAAEELHAVHRFKLGRPVGLRIADRVSADRDSILKSLNELRTVRTADATIADADQRRAFFRDKQTGSERKRLAVIVRNHLGQGFHLDYGRALARVNLCAFHGRQVGNFDHGFLHGIGGDDRFLQFRDREIRQHKQRQASLPRFVLELGGRRARRTLEFQFGSRPFGRFTGKNLGMGGDCKGEEGSESQNRAQMRDGEQGRKSGGFHERVSASDIEILSQ